MKVGRVIGTVNSTVKDAYLVGLKLLLTDILDGTGNVIEKSILAADTCGAGVGDMVIISQGSAARIPAKTNASPVDASIVAVIDKVSLGQVKAK